MIIKAYEHEKITKINNKIFLFYGENNGYKNQVVKKIFFEKFKGSVERYEENKILNNYDNFMEYGLIMINVCSMLYCSFQLTDYQYQVTR